MLGALDLLRRLGWSVIDLIYILIDTLFNIMKELNLYDIVDSVSNNSMFVNFHSGIMAISITTLALFTVWKFMIKIIEPDEGLSCYQIIMEVIKCGTLILMSVFLFSQANIFSIKFSGYTSTIFPSKGMTISNSILNMYISHSEGYKNSEEFKNENIIDNIQNSNFTKKRMFNDKYITSKKWILPDEKDYKYNINWLMALLVGIFFLFAILFSGMLLARRQIEFLFLFIISPIIFATSIGNKARKSAVIEQLVSLIFQSAVIMLIIGITVIVMQQINSTTFFQDSELKNMVLKSLMFIGCGTFLLTGSQTINRFIGTNVSANSGREQLMSLISYAHTISPATHIGKNSIMNMSALGLGMASSAIGNAGGNRLVNKVGNSIQNFGSKINNNPSNSIRSGIGNSIERFGIRVKNTTPSHIGKGFRNYAKENMKGTISSVIAQDHRYLARYRTRI